MTTEDFNIYQSAIETLILEGYVILQVIQPDGNTLYFNVYSFQEGYFNTAQSIDFNTVEGCNITKFLAKNSMMCQNKEEFLIHYAKELDKLPVVRLEFTKTALWYKWSMPISPDGKKNGRRI